jgi:coniferyl-aldehyde dehydrogenase
MSINRFTLQLDEIKAAYAAEPNPSLEVRLERISRIEQMIAANEEKICKVLAIATLLRAVYLSFR